MLRLDARGMRRAAREVLERPDPEILRREQESWVSRYWPVEGRSWVTALRGQDGELRFYREDF